MDLVIVKFCKIYIYDIWSWYFIKYLLCLINIWVVCLKSEKCLYVKVFWFSLLKFRVILVDEVIRFKFIIKIVDKLKCNKLLYNIVLYLMCCYKWVFLIELLLIFLGDEWLMLMLWCLYYLYFYCWLLGCIFCFVY